MWSLSAQDSGTLSSGGCTTPRRSALHSCWTTVRSSACTTTAWRGSRTCCCIPAATSTTSPGRQGQRGPVVARADSGTTCLVSGRRSMRTDYVKSSISNLRDVRTAATAARACPSGHRLRSSPRGSSRRAGWPRLGVTSKSVTPAGVCAISARTSWHGASSDGQLPTSSAPPRSFSAEATVGEAPGSARPSGVATQPRSTDRHARASSRHRALVAATPTVRVLHRPQVLLRR